MQLQVGPVKIGSEHPVALQTMTTTDTRNIQATVDQVRLIRGPFAYMGYVKLW
jgi:4-hydroxy-3-methylbut-2-en-1-yl diphosphate synthase IspG/GcpE